MADNKNAKKFDFVAYCTENKDLFESVMNKYGSAKNMYRDEYSILNYKKIFEEMFEFVDGYTATAAKGGTDIQYKGKVLTIAKTFYEKMLINEKQYRMRIDLCQFKDVTKDFLEGANKLNSFLNEMKKTENMSAEMNSLINMTTNQFNKICRVYKDDVRIYRWRVSSKTENTIDDKFAPITDQLKRDFSDVSTPVMHKSNKNRMPV